MKPTFAESDRLKALARSEDSLEILRAWWQRATGKPDDERPFMQQPMALVLLRFYRHSYERLRQLQAQSDKTIDDLQEMDRLESTLERETPEPTFLQRLDAAWRGTLTSSGDPVWDRWMEYVREGNIPDDWYGPLKQGVKG